MSWPITYTLAGDHHTATPSRFNSSYAGHSLLPSRCQEVPPSSKRYVNTYAATGQQTPDDDQGSPDNRFSLSHDPISRVSGNHSQPGTSPATHQARPNACTKCLATATVPRCCGGLGPQMSSEGLVPCLATPQCWWTFRRYALVEEGWESGTQSIPLSSTHSRLSLGSLSYMLPP